jgi:ATP-dependent Clp protease ATP-binding subunit ClpC
MFERFTDRSRRVLVYAQDQARDLNDAFIGTEHILIGLILEADGVAAKVLSSTGVTYDAVREKVKETRVAVADASPGSPPFTPRAKKVLELSLREALQLGHSYIGTEHILLGLVREGNNEGAQVLLDLGVELAQLREHVYELISGPSGREFDSSSTPAHRENTILRGVVRTVGQRLRPDLEPTALDDRAAKITEELYDELRKSWGEPDGSLWSAPNNPEN